MKDFAAIDFETANSERTSVCSVGIIIVRNGRIVDSFYSLIQPEPNYYSYWCQRVHGLGHEDTDDAPVFPLVWAQIEPLIEGLPLVAHNKAFDESCLKAVFRCYQMDYPDYDFSTPWPMPRHAPTSPCNSSSPPQPSRYYQTTLVTIGFNNQNNFLFNQHKMGGPEINQVHPR